MYIVAYLASYHAVASEVAGHRSADQLPIKKTH